MQYEDLHDLIRHSSSTRQYFLSLPIKMQLSLHKYNYDIHTAEQLHKKVSMIENYEHQCKISNHKHKT